MIFGNAILKGCLFRNNQSPRSHILYLHYTEEDNLLEDCTFISNKAIVVDEIIDALISDVPIRDFLPSEAIDFVIE